MLLLSPLLDMKLNLKLSPFKKLARWISPKSLPVSGDDNDTAMFAPELWDQIIDHLHNDKPTLLRLSLTSKQTLIRSRVHLFSELRFIHNFSERELNLKADPGRRFDLLLSLLEAPWTTFTNAVEFIHVENLFWPTRDYEHRPIKNLPRILANLPNLKTLRLTSIPWICIPPDIRDFFFQVNIVELQIDSVLFTAPRSGKLDLVEFFDTLQPSTSIKSMVLFNLQCHEEPIPNLSPHFSTFLRRIHLTTLDTCSLLLFKDVWDPLLTDDLDITVESFHVRLVRMSEDELVAYVPLFSRFLRHVGPSLQHIFIQLMDPYPQNGTLPYYAFVDLSQCINVRVFNVDTIELDHISHSGESASPMMATVWNSLSSLPPHSCSLEEVVLIFRACDENPEQQGAELESFAWLDLVKKLQEMFPNLKIITVGIAIFVTYEDFAPCLAALRRAPGLRQLEEEGTVSFQMIPWQDVDKLADPPWKSYATSL